MVLTPETIIWITVAATVAMIVLGGAFIGVTMIVRPKVLLRQRMNQIGVIGDSAGGAKNAFKIKSSNSNKRIKNRAASKR